MLGLIWGGVVLLAAVLGLDSTVEVAALLSMLVVIATVEPGSSVDVRVGREITELLV